MAAVVRGRPSGILALVLLLCGLSIPSCTGAPAAGGPDAAADGASASRGPSDGADEGSSDEVVVANCGRELVMEEPAQRVVAVNSASVENLLALGVDDRIVAATGRAESISEHLRDRFEALPLLDTGGEDYPNLEVVLDLEPQLLYSVYPSAFRDTGLASRDELEALGTTTYLAPSRCPEREETEPLTFDELWAEYEDLGALLGVEDVAADLVAEQRATVERVREQLPGADGSSGSDELSVLWWDVGTDEPMVGACCGAPAMILRELGLQNVFEDLAGHWSDASWEQVVERDPDAVVMVDFGNGDIPEKRSFVDGDATLRELQAFREERVVVLSFSQTTPGLQNVEAMRTLGHALGQWEAQG